MIISYTKRSILSLFFLLLLLLSLLNLSKLDQEISIKKQTINDTPVTIFEPKKDKIDNPDVYIYEVLIPYVIDNGVFLK